MNQTHLIKVGFVGLVSTVILGTFSAGQVVGQATIDLSTFRSTALSQHNVYRATHHAPSMTTSDSLNDSAQRWAEHLAATATFDHSGTSGVGENLYASYSTEASVDAATLANDAIQAWYDEVANYDYGNPGFSSNTGHFTQVVWKGSTQVGCGAAQGVAIEDGTEFNAFYVVCQYAPPGNMEGAYEDNVLQP